MEAARCNEPTSECVSLWCRVHSHLAVRRRAPVQGVETKMKAHTAEMFKFHFIKRADARRYGRLGIRLVGTYSEGRAGAGASVGVEVVWVEEG